VRDPNVRLRGLSEIATNAPYALRDVGASSNVWTMHKTDSAGRHFQLGAFAD
jgi:hypothetical protein